MSERLLRHLARALQRSPPQKLGVAVSGGSDSLALLVMLHALARDQGFALFAATVDHGLRAESATEAAEVGDLCRRLEVQHEVLVWKERDGTGNVQNAARQARYGLLGAWAGRHGLDAVALGHTQDDLAETFMMRLVRQAGVDGLSAMADSFDRDGARFIRPVLGMTRGDLQTYLTGQGLGWASDPSNVNPKYDRARTRKALAILADLGLSADRIAAVAQNMTDARAALQTQMIDLARAHVSLSAGAVAIDAAGLNGAPIETRRRLIAHALGWISGAYYAPRGSALTRTIDILAQIESATLQGCELRWWRGKLWIYRELNAVAAAQAAPGSLWDGRWRLMRAEARRGEFIVGPLGAEGLQTCPDWRDLGLPRGVLLASPAVWQADACIAAPLAGRAENWQARLERGEDEFFAAHMTH